MIAANSRRVVEETEISRARRRYITAHIASLAASERRAALDTGTSRARITSANAYWARCAEDRDRLACELEALGGDVAEARAEAESRRAAVLAAN